MQTNSMANKISEGVEIDVETFYQPDYSNPVAGRTYVCLSDHDLESQ